jgi:hypothetical protein
MLVRTQGGYVNLATITEAVLHADDSVTLHWGARGKNYTGRDAATLRQVLEAFAGNMRTQGIAATPRPHEEEERPDRAWAAAPPLLKMHSEQRRHGSSPRDGNADLTAGNEAEDESPKQVSALTRRVAQVMTFEPIASLSHKLRGVFLAAVEKATDFNHLAPKHRRLIQEAEACRRDQLRQ